MTDKKRTPDPQQQLALFQLMAERMPGVVWATDTDLRFTASFGAGLEALQLRPAQVVGMKVSEYLQTQDEHNVAIAAHRRALSGESVDYEFSWHDRLYHTYVQPLTDQKNAVIGCLGFAHDITDQRLAEDELRHSEAKWRSVADNAPAFVAIVDNAESMQFLNRSTAGTSVQEVLGTSVYDHVAPEYRKTAQDCIRRVLKSGGTATYESIGRGPHGAPSWYETRIGQISVDGNVMGVTLISNDITERKRSEEALRESERRLSTLMSNLPGMAYRCRNDRDWSMEFVSEGCFQLTGYPASGLINNRTMAYGQLIHTEERQAIWEQVQQAIFERRRFELEYRIITGQGHEKWVWEQGVGVFSDTGELEALEGFIADITARKRAELGLQEARQGLERRVDERTAELRQSNEQLELEVEERRLAEEQLSIFKAFVEASGQGFGMSDLNGLITYGNASIATLVGEDKPEHAYGKPAATYYTEGYQRREETELFPMVGGHGFWQGELTMVSTTGEHIPVFQTSFSLTDRAGNPIRRGVVITDLREIKRAQESLRTEQRALRRMLQASDRERQLITYEIHDGVAQRILGALMQFESYQRLDRHGSDRAQATFDAGMKALREASSETRSLMNRTATSVLDEFGVPAAIAEFIHQLSQSPSAPEITYDCQAAFERLTPILENTIHRVAQEAITNAVQHSESDRIAVTLTSVDDEVTLEVRDWGKGFVAGDVAEDRYGLAGIRERTRLLGKKLSVDSRPSQGTCIRATFPLVYRTNTGSAAEQ